MFLLCDEVSGPSPERLALRKALFEHADLSFELLCQVKEDFLLAKSVAVDMELEVGVLGSLCLY
jgi:hypothetical protein